MFKLKFIPFFLLFSGVCSAEYQMYYPLDKSIDIKFVSTPTTPEVEPEPEVIPDNWIPYDALYSEWLDSGEPFNCTAWTPDSILYNTDESLTQKANCDQVQTRTIQNREINTLNNEIRNSGELIEESTSVNEEETKNVNGSWATKAYTITVGLANTYHYGYMNKSYRNYYSLTLNNPSQISDNLYKGFSLDALYYNSSQGIVLAIDRAIPDTITPPTIIVNKISCTPSSIMYSNGLRDIYYYNNCSFNSVFTNNVGNSIIVRLK